MGGRTRSLSVGLVLVAALWAHPTVAQDASNAELKKEIQALGEAVKAVQKDLQDIKTLLQRGGPRPTPQSVVLDLGNHPFKGERTAKLTMVEFSDYQ